MKKFTVFYEDGTQFSGNPFNSEWKLIDETKKIIKLEYIMDKVGILMEGYKQYNHLLECEGMGAKGVARILLMGRMYDDTDIIILDLRQNRVYIDKKPLYREYGKQILDGWQKGMMTTPKCSFKKIK